MSAYSVKVKKDGRNGSTSISVGMLATFQHLTSQPQEMDKMPPLLLSKVSMVLMS